MSGMAKQKAPEAPVSKENAQQSLSRLQQQAASVMDKFAGEQGKANLKVLSAVQASFNEMVQLITPIVQRTSQLEKELDDVKQNYESTLKALEDTSNKLNDCYAKHPELKPATTEAPKSS